MALVFLVLFGCFTFLRFGFAPAARANPEPSNIFVDKPVDWQALRILFNQHATWDLEWYNSTSLQWISIKSDLTIQRIYPENDTCKIALVFDASQKGNYRLTFAVDARVRSYVNKTGQYQYELNYDDYSIVFDWNDVIAISGLQVTHGMTVVDGSDYFWFRMRRDNIPKNTHIVIDPTVIFSTVSVTSVHICPLDTHTFIIAYSDDTNDHISFQIYDTNGTQILAETDVDITAGSLAYISVGVSAFNSTTFVIGWFDKTDSDATFAVYNTTGSLLVGPTDVDTDVGTVGYGVQVSCFNSTHFVIGWFDKTDQDVTFAVYEAGNATAKAGPIDVDDTVGTQCYFVSVSAFNSTTFVIGWFDGPDYDVTFAVYDSAGTLLTGPTDASLLGYPPLSVSTFNSTHFVIGWYDYGQQDVTFAVYNSAGTLITGPTDVDTTAGANCYIAQVAALNSTAFVISWYDFVDYDLSFATYLSNGTAVAALTDVESWPTADNNPFQFQSPCSQETGTGIELYNDNWIIAYANTTTQAIWQAFMPNGTAWDGTIPSAGNTAPANDACDSTATFTVNIDGWVNMTVSDANLVADLSTVMIAVTAADSKTFNLTWTQASNTFAETLGASGICTLSGSSVRVNVDSDTDKIAFLFKISVAAQSGNCVVEATTTDDSAASDTDTYSAEFTIASYSVLTVLAGNSTHTWANSPSGTNDNLLDQGAIYFNVTANYTFKIQAKGDGNLMKGTDYIALGNVTIHVDTLVSSIPLTTTYADVGGLTSQSMGEDLTLSVKVWLDVPADQPVGNYVYTLTLQITSQ